MPLVLWKEIEQLNPTGMVIFTFGYVITGGGIFSFIVFRYRKISNSKDDDD